MIQHLKIALYFTVARYFSFFARIRLRSWKPRVVIITGSNGKTTALHLTAWQLGSAAKYSYRANSAFGIPFDILGLKRSNYSLFEWPTLFLMAPFYAFKGPHPEKLYVVEVDGDRPGDGDFFGPLLKPEVCVWLSSARTHSMLFEKSVGAGGFANVDEAIAYGFARFLAHTSKLAIINADNTRILENATRTGVLLYEIKEQELLTAYGVHASGSDFTISNISYRLPYVLPKEIFYGIASAVKIAEYFGIKPTNNPSGLSMPPGRSSVFRGLKNTTLLDSSYNADAESVAAIVRMAEMLPGEKWMVLGDLIEQGELEQEEHERLARILATSDFKRIVLVGPRTQTHVKPILQAKGMDVASFIGPKEALDYLMAELGGGETIVFKGARFLEGIIEHLLLDKADAAHLCRREAVWVARRKNFGL
ncbi:MAG: hypothetical protein A2854_02370 [Parcubacteria group bacterium RIFCSPHIGHO2_01_FULL_56_18]|nr:MAG: hypothetical protein A2854_02370 [Parcubacteria group bacterium RIFCSPHIGHO2_01_FULL_56_18]